jgi:hypothetical protein
MADVGRAISLVCGLPPREVPFPASDFLEAICLLCLSCLTAILQDIFQLIKRHCISSIQCSQ